MSAATFNFDNLLQKLQDPEYLPSYEEITAGFIRHPEGAYEFWSHCMLGTRFELLTKEYISALGSYLLQRIKELQSQGISRPFILEIGAGDGRLTHFLKEELHRQKLEQFTIIATDNQSWKQPIKTAFPVQNMSCLQALQINTPDIVICSWMPQGEDFTQAIRKTRSVCEYILISDPNVCGHPWKTWGDQELWEIWLGDHGKWLASWFNKLTKTFRQAPYRKDNYIRERILVNTPQLCRTDRFSEGQWDRHSCTESFRIPNRPG